MRKKKRTGRRRPNPQVVDGDLTRQGQETLPAPEQQTAGTQKEYRLRRWGDPALRVTCKPVEDFGSLGDLLSAMHDFAEKYPDSLGLAAPQLGDDRRVIIANFRRGVIEMVNPQITSARGFRLSLEKCYSIPLPSLPKIRRRSIELAYQDRDGAHHTETFKGLAAASIQHEIDHLDGILITDYFKRKRSAT